MKRKSWWLFKVIIVLAILRLCTDSFGWFWDVDLNRMRREVIRGEGTWTTAAFYGVAHAVCCVLCLPFLLSPRQEACVTRWQKFFFFLKMFLALGAFSLMMMTIEGSIMVPLSKGWFAFTLCAFVQTLAVTCPFWLFLKFPEERHIKEH